MKTKYLSLQVKRAFKLYPAILLVVLLTISSIVCAGAFALNAKSEQDRKDKITIGIVGDIQGTYLDFGINALKSMDSSRFYIEWLELSEEEANRALEKREIHGYVYIPKNFVEDLYRGRSVSADYVMLDAPEGFGSIVSAEIASMVSDMVLECQTGMYSMQDLAEDYNRKDLGKNIDKLSMVYVDHIINRNRVFDITVLGIADELTLGGYYVCGLLVLFLLLWGIACNRIFTARNDAYAKLLRISGLSPVRQVWCEYWAYLLVTMTTLLCFGAIVGVVGSFITIPIAELTGLGAFDGVWFVIKILPVVVMITLMQVAVYEMIPNTIAAVLMQFILTIVLGYISGCLYPNFFFPEALQKLAAVLPVGAGFAFVRRMMTGLPTIADVGLVCGYAAGFFALAVCMKTKRIAGFVK